MAAAEAAAPPGGGCPAAGGGSVPVLFCFSVFARPSTVPHGAGYELLIQKFLSLYGDQIDMHRKFVVQLFAEEWSQYIDLPKGFLVSERCKVRLVPLQIQVRPATGVGPDRDRGRGGGRDGAGGDAEERRGAAGALPGARHGTARHGTAVRVPQPSVRRLFGARGARRRGQPRGSGPSPRRFRVETLISLG